MATFNLSLESKKDYKSQEGVAISDFTIIAHEMSRQYDFDQGKNADYVGERNENHHLKNELLILIIDLEH